MKEIRESPKIWKPLKNFISFFLLNWVFIAGLGLFLVAWSRGYSAVVVPGLCIAVATLRAEHGLWGTGLQ